MNAINLKVRNMTCGSCVAHVKKALGALEGVSGVDVDLASGRVIVSGVRLPATDVLLNTLNAAGYPGAAESPRNASSDASGAKTNRRSGGCCCG